MPTAPTAKPNYPCTVFGSAGYLTRATSASLQTLGAAGSLLLRVCLGENTAGVTQVFLRAGSGYAPFCGVHGDDRKIRFCMGGNTTSTVINVIPVAGTWYDVLITWQYPGTSYGYVCASGGSDVTNSRATIAADTWNYPLYIAGQAFLVHLMRAGGKLRDVALFAKVVSPAEWAAYKTGTLPTGSLVASWQLYPDWADDSGNANDLTSGGIAPTFNPKAAPTPKAVPA